ncbi:MAG TPA: helix-turn-helix transcriptional regulator [Gemmatimonadales bacterium]|nr:helix-turn-helix transcriptional regulator [Gemmatimonadales bacterium]
MLTGAQIRDARSRLGWSAQQLAKKAHVPEPTVTRAERSSGEAAITLDQERRAALQVAGMEFSTDGSSVSRMQSPARGA